MVKVKGDLLSEFKKFIVGRHGQSGWNSIMDQVDPDVSELLNGKIKSKNWYDKKLFDQLLINYEETYSRKEVIQSAYFMATKQLMGFYGFAIKFLKFETIVSKMESMWLKNWSEGKLKKVEINKGYLKANLSNIDILEIHRIHIENYSRKIFEIVTNKRYSSESIKLEEELYSFEFNPRS